MRKNVLQVLMAVAMLTLATVSVADDLAGSNRWLCAAIEASHCVPEEECVTGPPWNWDIPQFIDVDLDAMTLRTTAASDENRATTFATLERIEGEIILQGHDRGRAFSFVIDEATGSLNAAIAKSGSTTTVFGSCTPRNESK